MCIGLSFQWTPDFSFLLDIVILIDATCVVFAIIVIYHDFCYWKADCTRIAGIVRFGSYILDFWSDVVFTLSLINCNKCNKSLLWSGLVFIILPYLWNIVLLSRYQNIWCKDATIRERLYIWFVSYQCSIYVLTILTGSAFATVELCNSYALGIDFLCMGLTERHLTEFKNSRSYPNLLFENIPHICIQSICLFTFALEIDSVGSCNVIITLIALITSVLSVCSGLSDCYASKKLFDVLKQDGEYIGKTSCSISIISTEVTAYATRLQITTFAFREAIAETLSIHPRSIEMYFPIATSTGFKMHFTIFSSKLTPQVILKRLKEGARSKLPKVCVQFFNLFDKYNIYVCIK